MNPLLSEQGFDNYINEELDDIQEMSTYLKSNNIVMDVEIPIVVHLVHQGEAVGSTNNMNHQDVLDAISRLNNDFEGTGIQFCPAKRTEAGEELEERGVVRVNASGSSGYATDNGIFIGSPTEYDVKSLGTQFSNHLYLNVWVVKAIKAYDVNGEIQGVGYFPNTTIPEIDGVMMKSSVLGLSTNRVFTHEVGHYLGLFHTFQGDDSDGNGYPDMCPSATADFPFSDEIADTQPHQRSPSGTCPSGNNTCPGGGNLEDITNNHMDYSREDCRDNFTAGQVELMQGTIMEKRTGLNISLGCQESCDPSFAVDFISDPENPISHDNNGVNGEEATFTYTGSESLYYWYVDGVKQSMKNEPLEMIFNTPGDHIVCLSVNDGSCQIQTCKTIRVFLGGLCYDPILDPCELVLNWDFMQYDESQIDYNGGESIHFDKPNTDITKMCNWMDYRFSTGANSFKGSPQYHITSSLGNPRYAFSLSATVHTSETIGTSKELELVDGIEYELSFDYNVYSISGDPSKGIFFGLSHEQGRAKEDDPKIIDIPNPSTVDLTPLNTNIYVNHKQSFIYTEDMGKYLFLSNNLLGVGAAGSNVLYVKNISIKACDFCDAQPNFSWEQSACNTFTLAGSNLNIDAPGFVSWSIDGITLPQFTGANDIEDLTFPFEGEYEVCMNITCPNGITNQDCQTIDVTGEFLEVDCHPCQNPTVVNAEAQRCGKESNEYVINNFAITVPKGYSTCNGQVFSQSFNGDILLNDYVIDNTGATEDVIYLSFTFLAEDADTENFGALFAVCSPDGLSTECFRIQINDPQTCNECSDDQSLVSNMSVNCIDIDPNDNIFMYAGSFTIDLLPGYQFCGASSVSAGVSVDAVNPNTNGSYNIGFIISTNNDGTINSSLTLCFVDIDDQTKHCFNVDLSVTNPCMPDDDNCEIDIPPYTISCTEVKDGLATFIFSYSLHLPQYVMDGYEFCTTDPITGRHLVTDRATITLGDTEIQVEPTIGVNAYIFAVELEVPCADLATNATSELIVNLCSETDMICADLDFNLLCPDCESTGGKRSVDELFDEYLISPNPTHQIFSIEAPESKRMQSYQIINTSGQLEMSGSLIEGTNIINFNNRTNGVYFIKIINGEEIITKRILIIK